MWFRAIETMVSASIPICLMYFSTAIWVRESSSASVSTPYFLNRSMFFFCRTPKRRHRILEIGRPRRSASEQYVAMSCLVTEHVLVPSGGVEDRALVLDGPGRKVRRRPGSRRRRREACGIGRRHLGPSDPAVAARGTGADAQGHLVRDAASIADEPASQEQGRRGARTVTLARISPPRRVQAGPRSPERWPCCEGLRRSRTPWTPRGGRPRTTARPTRIRRRSPRRRG